MSVPDVDPQQLIKRIGRALLGAAPPNWKQIRAEYRSVGRHIEADVTITSDDDQQFPIRPPLDVVELLGELRALMYRPGRGTWLSGLYVLDHPSKYNAEFEPDAEPRWRRLPPPIGFQDELRRFPREDAHIPAWLRTRAGLPPIADSTATPPGGLPLPTASPPPAGAAQPPGTPSGGFPQPAGGPHQPPATPPGGTPLPPPVTPPGAIAQPTGGPHQPPATSPDGAMQLPGTSPSGITQSEGGPHQPLATPPGGLPLPPPVTPAGGLPLPPSGAPAGGMPLPLPAALALGQSGAASQPVGHPAQGALAGLPPALTGTPPGGLPQPSQPGWLPLPPQASGHTPSGGMPGHQV